MAHTRHINAAIVTGQDGAQEETPKKYSPKSKREQEFLDGYRQYKASKAQRDIVERIDQLMQSSNSYIDAYYNRFFDNQAGYRSDSADYLKTVIENNNAWLEEAYSISDLIDKYREYYDPEFIHRISNYIVKTRGALSDILDDARSDNRYWSQWETEDDYNTYKEQQEADEAQRAEYEAYDVDAGQAEIDRLKGFANKANEIKKQLNEVERQIALRKQKGLSYSALQGQANGLNYQLFLLSQEYSGQGANSAPDLFRDTGADKNSFINDSQAILSSHTGGAGPNVQNSIIDFDSLIKEKVGYHEEAIEFQRINKLITNAHNDPQFEQYATYDASRKDRIVYSPSSEYYSSMALVYHYINATEAEKKSIEDNAISANGGITIQGIKIVDLLEIADRMEKDEKKMFNYLYASPEGRDPSNYEGLTRAETYFNSIKDVLKERDNEALAQAATKNFGTEVFYSAVAVASSLASGVEYVGDLLKYIVDESNDPYSAKMDKNSLAETKNIILGAVSDKVDWEIAGWDAFDFLYNTTMSMVESLAASVIPGGGVVLGLSAAAQGTNDALERGLSSEQAFWNGAVQGVFEGIFESVSIGKFKSLQESVVKSGKDICLNIAKSMLVNASEEAVTEVANILYDTIANGSLSNYEIMVQKYVNEGLSLEEAEKKAKGNLWSQVLESAASGALIGAGFGGIGSAMGYKATKKSAAFEKSLGAYSDEEISSIKKDSKNNVAKTVDDVISFVTNSVKDAFSGRLFVGKINANVAQRVKSDTGISVDGKSVVLSSDDIRHIFKQHGDAKSEAARGQEAITIDNFSDVMEAIFSPDSVTSSTDKSGVVSLVFTREAGNKTTAVTISSDKKKALTLKSAWITKKGQHISQKSDVQAPNQTSNNELSMNAVNNSISQTGTNVNSENLATPVGQAKNYARILGMGENGTRGLVAVSESLQSGADLGNAAQAFNAIYNQGKSGKAFAVVKFGEMLTAEQRQLAYQYGIMDRALEGASTKNSPEGLKNGAESGTIESTQPRRENSDGNEKQHIQDRRRESGVPESQSGTRKEDSRGSRVQSKVGSTKEENPVYASGRPLGLNYDGSETPFNVGDTVEPSEDSDVYVNQQRVTNEYGVDCYVIKSDVWESADHDAPAGAYKGKVYVSEDIDPELVATLAPHEGSHIMKQLKFRPYLDFIDNVADMIDRSKIETQKLFEIISEHIGADVLGEMDPGRFYDEMNASIYGFYKAGMMESTGFGELVSEAFYDFDAYIAELDAIHEQYKQEVKSKREASDESVIGETTPVGQAKNYARILGMGENGTRGLVAVSESLQSGADLGNAAQAFNAIYNQGKSGKAFAAVKFGETLTAEQRQLAYQYGIMDRALEGARNKNSPEGLKNGAESGTIESTTSDTPPRRKARTEEERQAARKRQIESEQRRLKQQSKERQKYLADKFEEYRNVIEQLRPGDKLIGDNGIVIGEVVDTSDGCVLISGEEGFVESILPNSFISDAVISILEVGDGHFEKPDGTWIDGTKNNAIWKYKSSESYKINEAIRSGRELTAEESAFIEELDRDLEKTPKYSGVTYRNISFDMQGQETLDNFVAGHTIGEIVTYPAYTSTSKTKEGYVVDGELLVHIEISGENGHDISKGYGIEEEQEVLYGRKTRFVVTSVSYDGKTANIVMEEFANGERAIQRGIERNKPTQQGHNTSNIKSSMQQMQESLPEESDDNLQDVSQRSTRRDSGQRSDLQGVRGEVNKSDARRAAEYYLEEKKRDAAELGIDFDYQLMLTQIEQRGEAAYKTSLGEVYRIIKKSNGKYIAAVEGEGSGLVQNALTVECDSFDEAYLAIEEYFMEQNDTLRESMLNEHEGAVIGGESSAPDVQQAKENAIDHERVVYSSNKAMAYDAISRDKLDAKQRKVVDIAAQIGRKVIFATTVNKDGVEVDGFIAKNGDIYINPNKNVAPMAFVFKHELAHFAERAGQKYQDFKNTVRNSATFKNWLKEKGLTEQEYISQIIRERAAIGQQLDEFEAIAEMMANFVGDMLFTDQSTWAEDLIRELGPKQRKTVREYIRDFFSWIKSKFVGDAGKAKVEVRKLEKAFGAAYRTAVESNAGTNGEQFSFQGYAKDGKGKYKSNFPKGTPKSAKAKVILDYIKNVWSKKPIALQINENGKTRTIQAQFDPTYDETENVNTDASKLMGGNRHGTSSDQRVTLDLADDYYQIATESTYNYSKDETGKDNPTHKDVKKWHYFINDIYFAEYNSDNYVPYRVTINIKEKADGTFVYSFSAENQERLNTPRTLHAVVKGDEVTPNVQPSNISISNSHEKNNSKNAQNFEEQTEQFSYTPQNEKIDDVLDRVESGELTLDEARKLLKKPEGDTPASIANLKPEDMGTTPRVSKKTNGNAGDGDSRFSESVKRSSIFDDNFKKEVGEDNFVKHYASITNKETLAEAAQRLDEGGEAYVTDWLSKKTVHMDTVDTMVGFILLKRYQDIGDYSSAAAVAQKVREVGTLSGQRVQAFSIIGRFDADMMQTYAQRELDKAWELAIEGRSDKWLEKHKDQFMLTDEEISFIRDNILYAARMPENSRERAIALAQITTLIQNKIPPVRGQSFKAWQRVSMLLNPKTQIRNVIGNAMMAPVFVTSDFFSSVIDKIVSLKTNKRTTGITARGAKAAGKGFRKGLYESFDDFRRNIDSKQQELDRYSIGNGIRGQSFDEHTRFKALNAIAKKLNALDDITSHLLDIGDRPFFEMWYMWSLNNQMVKNNVDIPTLEMMDIATEEALERTWQNDTTFSKVASKAKHVLNLPTQKKLGYGLGDVLIKFTKTPANIARAIYEYSPVSFVSAISSVRKLRRAFVKGEDVSKLQKQFVSRAGKAFTGCVIYGIIAALYAMGHIAGAGDEDDDAAAYERYIQGIPDYSIKSGDKWITYDWAQPLGAYVAIVAEFLDSCKNGDSADPSIKNAISAGGGVLMDQSFMSSIQEFFAGSPDGEFDIFNSIFSSILNDVSAMVPTLFSQIASFTDDKKRVTYDNTSEVNTAINRILIKIPGLRRTLEADVDVFGREIPNSQNNFYDAFLNAGNMYSNTSDDITDHAYEIYKSTGDVGAIPAKAPYSVKYQNQSKKLTDEERAEYQRVMGGVAYDMIDVLLENEVYLEMSDNEKLAVLKEVYSYSAAFAKNEIAWYDSYEVIHGIADYITERDFENMTERERIQLVENDIFQDYKYMNDIESDEGMANYLINKKTPNLVLSATLAGDIDEAVKLIEGIEARVQSYGWSDADVGVEVKECRSDVKDVITRHWKGAYAYAKEKGDTAEMERIEEMIKSLGLYVKTNKFGATKFDDTLFDTWIKDTEKDN